MRHSECERRRRALEKQLHDDLALIRAGHQAKLRALEMLWLASPEAVDAASEPVLSAGGNLQREPEDDIQAPNETQTASETQSETQDPSETQEDFRMALQGGLQQAIRDVLPRLPEVFNKYELTEALGFEPRRATLLRAIERLLADKQIKVEQPSTGRRATRYRKVAGPA